MGYKNVCLSCRKSFSVGMDTTVFNKRNCPTCQNQMTILHHKFKPPKSDDDKGWKLVEFLCNHGFRFQNVYKELGKGLLLKITYPKTIAEAKEFVEEFKIQSIK